MNAPAILSSDQLQANTQKLTAQIFREIGKAEGLILAEKMQLVSENNKLQNEIAQERSVQVAKVNAVVCNNRAKRELIIQKLKTIVQKLDEWNKAVFKGCCSNPPTSKPFMDIIDSINAFSDPGANNYPEFVQDPVKIVEPETAVVPFTPLLDLCKTDPVLLSLIKESTDNYVALRNELAPLKKANLALIQQKSDMIAKHERHVKAVLIIERETRLQVILSKVRAIHTGRTWSTPIVSRSACKPCKCDGHIGIEACTQQIYHEQFQVYVNKRLKKAENLVKDLIDTLEAFVA